MDVDHFEWIELKVIELREPWLNAAMQLAVEIHIRKDLVFNSTDSLRTLKEKASG